MDETLNKRALSVSAVFAASLMSGCALTIMKQFPDDCEAIKAHVHEHEFAYNVGTGLVAAGFAFAVNETDSDRDADFGAPISVGIGAVGFPTIDELKYFDCSLLVPQQAVRFSNSHLPKLDGS